MFWNRASSVLNLASVWCGRCVGSRGGGAYPELCIHFLGILCTYACMRAFQPENWLDLMKGA